jgi:hypothetical protein
MNYDFNLLCYLDYLVNVNNVIPASNSIIEYKNRLNQLNEFIDDIINSYKEIKLINEIVENELNINEIISVIQCYKEKRLQNNIDFNHELPFLLTLNFSEKDNDILLKKIKKIEYLKMYITDRKQRKNKSLLFLLNLLFHPLQISYEDMYIMDKLDYNLKFDSNADPNADLNEDSNSNSDSNEIFKNMKFIYDDSIKERRNYIKKKNIINFYILFHMNSFLCILNKRIKSNEIIEIENLPFFNFNNNDIKKKILDYFMFSFLDCSINSLTLDDHNLINDFNFSFNTMKTIAENNLKKISNDEKIEMILDKKLSDDDLNEYCKDTDNLLNSRISFKLAFILQSIFFQTNLSGYGNKTKELFDSIGTIGVDTSISRDNIKLFQSHLKWFNLRNLFNLNKYFPPGDASPEKELKFPEKIDKDILIGLYNNLIILSSDIILQNFDDVFIKSFIDTIKKCHVISSLENLLKYIKYKNNIIIYSYYYRLNVSLNIYFLIIINIIENVINNIKNGIDALENLLQEKKSDQRKFRIIFQMFILTPILRLIEIDIQILNITNKHSPSKVLLNIQNLQLIIIIILNLIIILRLNFQQ